MAEKRKQPAVDIVIPYLATGSVWDELLYLLRSIEKNAAFEHRIFLISDVKPRFTNENLRFIKVDNLNVPGNNFSRWHDVNNKLINIAKNPDISDNFIFAYIDQLWLENLTSRFFSVKRAYPQLKNYNEINKAYYSKNGGEYWKNALLNSINLLTSENLPTYIYETHLPRIFNKKQIIETHKHFNIYDNPSVIFSTLHFNFHFSNKNPSILNQKSKIVKHIRKHYTHEELYMIFTSYKIIDYKPYSLSAILKKYIDNCFPENSQYEKL